MQVINGMKDITSSSNPIIKEVKGLYKKKERWNKNLFIIEGVKIVEECIRWGKTPKYILFSEELFSVNGGEELFSILKDNHNLIKVPNSLFRELADTEKPQGILAVVDFNISKMDEVVKEKKNFIIILDELQDPGNVGTIIRSADAFGVSGIIVTENCVDVYNPKVVRATMGSLFHIPITYIKDKKEVINYLKDRQIRIYTTSLQGETYIYDADFKENFAFIIGNESKGVTEEMIKFADLLIKIPMEGNAESLNAAIASSIIMYEVARQRFNIS